MAWTEKNNDLPDQGSSALRKEYPLVIPYQILLDSATAGKHIGFTKRRIRFKFGLTHIGSVLKGMTGVDCRGLEMEVQVIWSVTGGKFTVLFNHHLIHRSVDANQFNQYSKMEHTFLIPEVIFPGGHSIYVAAYALKSSPDGHKFELKLDGQNYHDFLPIYALGMPQMHNMYGTSLEAERNKQITQLQLPPNITTPVTMVGNGDVDLLVQGRPRYVPGQKRSPHPRSNNSNRAPPPVARNNNNPNMAAGTVEEEQKMLAQARLASFRDLREKNNNAHASFAARPSPPTTTKLSSTQINNMIPPLQPVRENDIGDFIDLNSYAPQTQKNKFPLPNPPDLLRSTSSLTNDFDDDNDTTIYSHLDPRQAHQTQQNMNLSFQLQSHPPSYADSQMGDIMNSAPSTRNKNNSFRFPVHPSTNNPPPSTSLRSSMPVDSTTPYYGAAAPPPPTWEDLNNNSVPPPPTWEDLNTNFSQSMNFSSPNHPSSIPQQQQSNDNNSNYQNYNFPSSAPLSTQNW